MSPAGHPVLCKLLNALQNIIGVLLKLPVPGTYQYRRVDKINVFKMPFSSQKVKKNLKLVGK